MLITMFSAVLKDNRFFISLQERERLSQAGLLGVVAACSVSKAKNNFGDWASLYEHPWC